MGGHGVLKLESEVRTLEGQRQRVWAGIARVSLNSPATGRLVTSDGRNTDAAWTCAVHRGAARLTLLESARQRSCVGSATSPLL